MADTGGEGPIDGELLFATVEKLQPAAAPAGSFGEYDTQAEFVNKYLGPYSDVPTETSERLRYTQLGDIRRGWRVDAGNFPDHVLNVHENARVAIEAKELGAALGPKEAAQVGAYCSSLGGRWGAVSVGCADDCSDSPVS